MDQRCWVAMVVMSWVALAAGCGDPAESAPSYAQQGRIIGRIEIGQDLPATKCMVQVEGMPRGAKCDASGLFDISRVSTGRRDLRIIENPDKKPVVTARRVAAAVNPGFLTDLGAIRILKGGSIFGRVKTSDGSVPLAIISVPVYGAVTAPNDSGAYLLTDVPPGMHDVVLTIDGGDVKVADVEVKSLETTAPVDFDLSQVKKHTVDVSGRAVREGKADGGHADLTLELREVVDGKVVQSTTTSGDGAFALQAPSGVYQLRARDGDNPVMGIVPYLLVHGEDAIVIPYDIVVPAQSGDLDGDGLDNDKDIDGDGVPNDKDAFPYDPAETTDTDKDGIGDNADLKSKGGKWIDNRPATPDTDSDGLFDPEDNCISLPNTLQTDSDGDKIGDPCDNCPYVPNTDQLDSLADGIGDACRTCITGESCTPGAVCNQGTMSCPKSGPVCADVGVPAPSGTPCGPMKVCNNGTCGDCNSGESCSPAAAPCNKGVVSCTTGLAVCKDTQAPAPNGTPCGTGQVCNNGKCESCQDGGDCIPTTLCKVGKLDCSTGQPFCVGTSQSAPDGQSCGTSLFCKAGACVPCAEGQSCTPQSDPCHAGTFSCTTGTAVCVDTGNLAPDGTPCGSGTYCKAGVCTTLPNNLAIVSGDAQSGYAGAVLGPVVLKLTDGGGQPLAGEQVSFTAPTGGAVTPPSALTSTSGLVTVTPSWGRRWAHRPSRPRR